MCVSAVPSVKEEGWEDQTSPEGVFARVGMLEDNDGEHHREQFPKRSNNGASERAVFGHRVEYTALKVKK